MADPQMRGRGELQREILRALRSHKEPVTARQVREDIAGHKPAYVTTMTVLSRLVGKGQASRVEDTSGRVRFQATRSDEEHTGSLMSTALRDALDPRATLLYFAGTLSPAEAELLKRAIAEQADSPEGDAPSTPR